MQMPNTFGGSHYRGRRTQPTSTEESKEDKVIVRAEDRCISCSRKQVWPHSENCWILIRLTYGPWFQQTSMWWQYEASNMNRQLSRTS